MFRDTIHGHKIIHSSFVFGKYSQNQEVKEGWGGGMGPGGFEWHL